MQISQFDLAAANDFLSHRPRGEKKRLRQKSRLEKRIEYFLKRDFPENPEQKDLLLQLASLDPTDSKKYLGWLLKHWISGWRPDSDEEKNTTSNLKLHDEASQFSATSSVGIRLKKARFKADIFEYTPKTLPQVSRRPAAILQQHEEDQKIRAGKPVSIAGAEIAYQDDQITVNRIRTSSALRRFSEGTAWCVKDGNPQGYLFPFDHIVDELGERHLTNDGEFQDRWNRDSRRKVIEKYQSIESNAMDSLDRMEKLVAGFIESNEQLPADLQQQLLNFPSVAITYFRIHGPSIQFEEEVSLSKLGPRLAAKYAIEIKKSRWPRAEKVISRKYSSRIAYRKEFPSSQLFSKAEIRQRAAREEKQKERLAEKQKLVDAVTSSDRDHEFEAALAPETREFSSYCKLLAQTLSNAVPILKQDKFRSYFLLGDSHPPINRLIAPAIIRRLTGRVLFLEGPIAKNAELALAYAMVCRMVRFPAAEPAILRKPTLAVDYSIRVLKDRWLFEESRIRRDVTAWRKYSAHFGIRY